MVKEKSQLVQYHSIFLPHYPQHPQNATQNLHFSLISRCSIVGTFRDIFLSFVGPNLTPLLQNLDGNVAMIGLDSSSEA